MIFPCQNLDTHWYPHYITHAPRLRSLAAPSPHAPHTCQQLITFPTDWCGRKMIRLSRGRVDWTFVILRSLPNWIDSLSFGWPVCLFLLAMSVDSEHTPWGTLLWGTEVTADLWGMGDLVTRQESNFQRSPSASSSWPQNNKLVNLLALVVGLFNWLKTKCMVAPSRARSIACATHRVYIYI